MNKLFQYIFGYYVAPIGEICTVVSGGTPSKKKMEYWNNGNIKWLSSTVCENKKTVRQVTDYITEEGLANSSAKIMKPNTTLIALVGATIGKTAFLPYEAAINQNIAGIYPINEEELLPEYVYYACTALYDQFVSISNGKLVMANMSFVKNLEICIPSIDRQRYTISVLNRFNKLCNDLSESIPAEIEARQKQYEYYCNKLLSFQELK